MRILYLNHELLRSDNEAGIWSREVVRELRHAGAEVIALQNLDVSGARLSARGDGLVAGVKAMVKQRAPKKIVLRLVEYYLQASGLIRTLRVGWKLWRKRRDLKASVILVRTYEYDWTPLIAARLLKLPIVLEVHTPFYLERKLRGHRTSELLRRFERMQWRAADRIWVNSHELETIIAENIDRRDRLVCIPHGIRMEQFIRHARRHPHDTIWVIFVGSFYHWHGVELLIDAFASVLEHAPGARLRLVGDGLTRHACEERAQHLGISGAVEFTGWVSREQVLEYLAEADIGVAPYLELETFYFDPVKIIEYMAAGLAVVASRQGSIARTVEHGKDGLLIPPDDVNALAEAIATLASDAALCRQFGEAAREKIARNQSWDVVAGRILSLCNDALAERESN